MYSVHVQVKGSHLASIFSGRWEGCLDHDANGRIFLDFDPYSFQQILMTLRCRPFDLAKNVAPPEAVMTPDKLHAYKCLVDYLGLEGVCGAADESSNLASDTCQLTHVSDNAIVTQGVTKGQWVTCVRPIKIRPINMHLQMLVLRCQQSKCITSSWRTHSGKGLWALLRTIQTVVAQVKALLVGIQPVKDEAIPGLQGLSDVMIWLLFRECAT